MRVLAIYRHYLPDATPYARLLHSILRQLSADGHRPTVLTAQPSYNDIIMSHQPGREDVDGISIRRVALFPEKKSWKFRRLINTCLFLGKAFWHVCWNRREYDLIMANSHPPVVMGWMLSLLRRLFGIPYLYHCQDIHPEGLLNANRLAPGVASWLMRKIDHQTCRQALCIVTLSNDMQKTLCSRGDEHDLESKITVLNNFPLEHRRVIGDLEIPDLFRQQKADGNGSFRILFAGNIGDFQGLEGLIDAGLDWHRREQSAGPRHDAGYFQGPCDVKFILMGAGAAVERLQHRAEEALGKTIHFLPHVDVEVAFACLERSDLAVVSLSPGVHRVAYPSKTMSCLEAGVPLLAIVEPESQLAREVEHHRFGYVVPGRDPEVFTRTIRAAMASRTNWGEAERAALRLRADQCFGRRGALANWSRLFRSLEQHGPAWSTTWFSYGHGT